MVNQRKVRHAAGVMYLGCVTLLIIDHVRYVGHGGDHAHVKLAVQTLLHDLHMQQSQESAAESESQRCRCLGEETQ